MELSLDPFYLWEEKVPYHPEPGGRSHPKLADPGPSNQLLSQIQSQQQLSALAAPELNQGPPNVCAQAPPQTNEIRIPGAGAMVCVPFTEYPFYFEVVAD